MNQTVDHSLIESEREYVEFLDETDEYKDRINALITRDGIRLMININDLRRQNSGRANKLLENTCSEIVACQRAIKKCIQNINPDFAKTKHEFFVGFEGSFGSRHVTPRTLNSKFLGNMVCLEGIVTKASLIRPKVVCSVHYCPATKKTIERRYADLTSLEPYPSVGIYPTKDDEGNLLETEYGLSVYSDHQTLTIQEMPETAPVGQLPRSIDALLDNDLVDAVQPGDRVQIVGHYRCLPGKKNGFTTANFRTVIIANNVQSLSKETGPNFSEKDISMMRLISKRNDVISLLTRSIAPSICGHEHIKQAILLLLLGGVERHLTNGSRIRGDINLLLMGDPSVAKSQFLRFVLHIAHRAIATTGRGSSGVGLTAAVTADMETGERSLEAGAMVLADRGIVCIDEFDKMSDIDRTAIHEVMEQGRVTISKAGIQAKLNARCSVLAAANPVYGKYDQYKTPMENIGLQDSLLSRFDLLFIVLDKADPDSDRTIAEHVLKIHRYRGPGEQEGEALPLQCGMHLLTTGADPLTTISQGDHDDDDVDGGDISRRQQEEDQVYEQHNEFLIPSRGRKQDQLTIKFLQKYIHVARQLKPQLTKEAASILAEKYCDLRAQEASEAIGRPGRGEQNRMRRTQPITARSLETLIRLSTAHAKARMSKTVTKKDAEAAVQLLSFVLFKEVLEKTRRKRDRNEDDGVNESDNESENGDDTERNIPQQSAKRRPVVSGSQSAPDPNDPYAFADDPIVARSEPLAETVPISSALHQERTAQISTMISRIFQERRVEQLTVTEITNIVRSRGSGFNQSDIRATLESMHKDNRIMLAGDDVWLI
ncbi:Zygotic DNA replication licensing factor mcm3 [Schistosoma japonicum]|uniref:DNA replication licensing factor MCM3 n=1 Tax=Schistosoma japonicum TaxID=6182 RepID=A0A4Z2D7F0_SCHJA|nr:DNA replication licensing factor MCM3 [Schistosoma japonicum]KAH8861677.1 DNA replication licensing factor MCM3 [Schistosoma japonicum]TNN12366.1 Zygotic DNA replication licensing factor mcm3 [Schistosoma japonicum]